MPDRLAYDEAMQLSRIRLKIQDPELKQGQVETIHIHTASGAITRPWGIEGGFAVVYKFRTKSGNMRALRCFRVAMGQDMQFRYERIGPYFHTCVEEITAGFHYYMTGISVKEQIQLVVYPVIDMDWIDGVTLIDKIHELCQQHDQGGLRALAEQWISVLRVMREAHIAHGDLSGLNVMVKADGKLLLIDYDGVYIPEFAGLTQLLIGQEDYQHPQVAQRQFNEDMDHFSALVIYLALVALAEQPELWEKYTAMGADRKPVDTNILFRHEDFKDPQNSALFRELAQASDAHVRDMAQSLLQACLQPVGTVRFPFERADPQFQHQAFAKLQQDIQANDDELICTDWSTILEEYAPAQAYRGRVQLAQQRIQALKGWRAAVRGHHLIDIVRSYDAALLDPCQNVTCEERQLISAARRFDQLYGADKNDVALLQAHDGLQPFLTQGLLLSPEQVQRVQQTRRYSVALAQFRAALSARKPQQIVASYDLILDNYPQITVDEREKLLLARQIIAALQTDDLEQLCAVAIVLQASAHRTFFSLTELEQDRLLLAEQRQNALSQLRAALQSRQMLLISNAYPFTLDIDGYLSQEEREQVAFAHRLVKAFVRRDDDELSAVDQQLLEASLGDFFLFTDQERQSIALARDHVAALARFRQALAFNPKDARSIVSLYNTNSLKYSNSISDKQREIVEEARNYIAMQAAVQEGIRANNDDTILGAYIPELGQRFASFTPEEQRRIDQALMSKELARMLDRGEYGLALKMARTVQATIDSEISDSLTFKLKRATMRFIRQNELTNLAVQIEMREYAYFATVSWQWPQDDLIEHALIVWHSKTWPSRPSERSWKDPEWMHIWSSRARNTLHGTCTFSIYEHPHIYVRGFAALLDTWGQEQKWRFSDGDAPTSNAKAASSQVLWHLL